MVDVRTTDLAQLEAAFEVTAARSPDVEARHAEVHRRVTWVRFALYRDFPDPVRVAVEGTGQAVPGGGT